MLFSPTPSRISFETLDKDKIRNVYYIKQLLDNPILSPNTKFVSGVPILAFAIQHEAFETVKFLLEKNADLDATDDQGISCLDYLRNTSPEFFYACFDLALEKEYWTIITAYLSKNMSNEDFEKQQSQVTSTEKKQLTQFDKSRIVLLYLAIQRQLPRAVKFLLEHNVSTNVKCEMLGSPLRFAIKCLEYPSDGVWVKKEASNYQANNPVMYKIIELLLKYKAVPREFIRTVNNNIYSPITFSVHNHDTKLLDLLLTYNPYLADHPPKEATAQFLCEEDDSGKTPLAIAFLNKSRKMYGYLLKKCPDLLLSHDIEAFSEFFGNPGDYANFMHEILSSLPLAKRKLLFQDNSSSTGEIGDGAVLLAMRRNSLSITSALLRNGANLPIVRDQNGNLDLDQQVKRKLALRNWKAYFQQYFQALKAAQVTPSLTELSTNFIYDCTHQNESAINQLKAFMPTELFELYKTTPQRQSKRENYFKPIVRECLENALSVNMDADEQENKRAKTIP